MNASPVVGRLSIVCPSETQYRPKYGLLICEAGIVDLRRIMASWGEHPDSLGCGPFVASIHPGAKLTAIKHANSVEFMSTELEGHIGLLFNVSRADVAVPPHFLNLAAPGYIAYNKFKDSNNYSVAAPDLETL